MVNFIDWINLTRLREVLLNQYFRVCQWRCLFLTMRAVRLRSQSSILTSLGVLQQPHINSFCFLLFNYYDHTRCPCWTSSGRVTPVLPSYLMPSKIKTLWCYSCHPPPRPTERSPFMWISNFCREAPFLKISCSMSAQFLKSYFLKLNCISFFPFYFTHNIFYARHIIYLFILMFWLYSPDWNIRCKEMRFSLWNCLPLMSDAYVKVSSWIFAK